MKKFFVIMILFFLLVLLNYNKVKTVTVFYTNDKSFYTLNTSKLNISNKNINDYFTNEEVILVKLRFNPIYKNRIKDTYCKLEEVNDVYENKMNSIKLLEKYNKFNDIYFDEIRVYALSNKIDEMIKDYDFTIIKNKT